ncbi:hypothetical protein [Numidum massiliense]|uniref:hypothetical protein n=1 Tax=Numidum massiliense TaxID=1522315 RepID=UPI0006D58295|nr:hypothetical protein [Numidum massiliense]
MKRIALKDNPIQLTREQRLVIDGRDIQSPVHKVDSIEGALSLLHLDDDQYLLVMKDISFAIVIESSAELAEKPLHAYFSTRDEEEEHV